MDQLDTKSYLTTHAGISLAPKYRTLPEMTSWFRDCINSWMEVL